MRVVFVFGVVVVMSAGCVSRTPRDSAIPAALRGSEDEIRARFLSEIPVGTTQAEAERILKPYR